MDPDEHADADEFDDWTAVEAYVKALLTPEEKKLRLDLVMLMVEIQAYLADR